MRFSYAQRLILFSTLWVQLTLVMLTVGSVISEHGSGEPVPVEEFYWLMTAGLALPLLLWPVVFHGGEILSDAKQAYTDVRGRLS